MSMKHFDSIVVGGGIAGLTAAAYLARAGQQVILFEKNPEPGGLVNSFSRNGFQFEAGVRALENAGIIFPMLKQLGIDLEVVRSYVSVGIGDDIIHIEDINSLEDYRQLLIRNYPESKEDIDKVIKVIVKVMKHMEVLYGLDNPAFVDYMTDKKYLFTQLLPWLPKFLFTVGKINSMNMPVEGYLKEMIKDDSLRDIISQHFFKNTPTFFALSYFSLYLDYFYPKGGVGELAEKVKAKLEEFGGIMKLETIITEVDAFNKTVKDDQGIIYKYDNMVWAADLKNLYKLTKTEGLASKIISRFEKKKQAMLSSHGSDSIFSLYLQIDEPLETFKKVANGHFFYTPSKQGLGDTHRGELEKMLENWEGFSKEDILKWLKKFLTLNTFEISIPGLKDPDLVPEGKTGMIISFLTEYRLFKKISEDGWYKEFQQEVEKITIQVINDSLYPMLKEKTLETFSFTPLAYMDRILSSEGSIVGWTFEKPIPVENKIQNSAKSVLTPLPNIYQAGQWAYSPSGVPMSILTGKLAVDKVLLNSKKKSRL